MDLADPRLEVANLKGDRVDGTVVAGHITRGMCTLETVKAIAAFHRNHTQLFVVGGLELGNTEVAMAVGRIQLQLSERIQIVARDFERTQALDAEPVLLVARRQLEAGEHASRYADVVALGELQRAERAQQLACPTLDEIEIVRVGVHEKSVVIHTWLRHADHYVVVEQERLTRKQGAEAVRWQFPGLVVTPEQAVLGGRFWNRKAFNEALSALFVRPIAMVEHRVAAVEPLAREALFVQQIAVRPQVTRVGLFGHTPPHDAVEH
jgi:hypothetical protein